jgi:Glycoside Hydrolase Family 113
MNQRAKIFWAFIGLVLLAAGCATVAHAKSLQPKRIKPAVIAHPVAPRAMQLGVDIDAYTYRGQNVARAAATDVSYITSLHANSVSISFPFFMTGPSADAVEATSSTPTPVELSAIIMTAERAGLYVSIRPLLDEKNLDMSRVGWKPTRRTAWFASYARFLLPYAVVAQADHVQEFIVGAEFTRFPRAAQWNTLDAKIRKVYTGTLAYASNWDGGSSPVGMGGRAVTETVDAYPPIRAGRLLAGWEAYDRQLPAGTVETEVGIDAIAGANRDPSHHHWPMATRVDPGMQATWFAAACRAAVVAHLGGIYFWSLVLGKPSAPSLAGQGAWADSSGSAAIRRCFGSLQGVGK